LRFTDFECVFIFDESSTTKFCHKIHPTRSNEGNRHNAWRDEFHFVNLPNSRLNNVQCIPMTFRTEIATILLDTFVAWHLSVDLFS
ncbi:hypothetical protein PENTCL1PPCAC_8514, partial [Pristionchus entomophagus]